MKTSLTLGPRGVEALVALCTHCMTNGSFAVAGGEVAFILITAAGAADETSALLRSVEYRTSRRSIARLELALDALRAKDGA